MRASGRTVLTWRGARWPPSSDRSNGRAMRDDRRHDGARPGGTDDRVDPAARGVPGGRRGVARRAHDPHGHRGRPQARVGSRRVQRGRVPRALGRRRAAAAGTGQGVDQAKAAAATTPCRPRSRTAASATHAATPRPSPASSAEFDRPTGHETHSVTTGLIAPTIRQWGTAGAAGRAASRGSSPPASCAASCSPSRVPVRTSPTCRAGPSPTATSGSSTGRRSGARAPSSPSGAC